ETIGGVSVTYNIFNVTFVGALGNQPQPQIFAPAAGNTLSGFAGGATGYTNIVTPTTVETVTIPNADTSGTLQLAFNGQTTAAITLTAAPITAAAFATALVALPTIANAANINVSSAVVGTSTVYTIGFYGGLGLAAQPQVTVVGAAGTSQATVTTSVPASIIGNSPSVIVTGPVGGPYYVQF